MGGGERKETWTCVGGERVRAEPRRYAILGYILGRVSVLRDPWNPIWRAKNGNRLVGG